MSGFLLMSHAIILSMLTRVYSTKHDADTWKNRIMPTLNEIAVGWNEPVFDNGFVYVEGDIRVSKKEIKNACNQFDLSYIMFTKVGDMYSGKIWECDEEEYSKRWGSTDNIRYYLDY